MSSLPAVVPSGPLSLSGDLADAIELAKAEKAQSTRRAYSTDLRLFAEWCKRKGASQLPAAPETVAAFLAAEAKARVKASTLARRVAAIRYAHRLSDVGSPTDAEAVKATMRGIRRTFGGANLRKTPAVAAKIRAMVALAPETLAGHRDRALLLLGFAGAFRRSGLVALDVGDVEKKRWSACYHSPKQNGSRAARCDNCDCSW